jgi:hypothetical protein
LSGGGLISLRLGAQRVHRGVLHRDPGFQVRDAIAKLLDLDRNVGPHFSFGLAAAERVTVQMVASFSPRSAAWCFQWSAMPMKIASAAATPIAP